MRCLLSGRLFAERNLYYIRRHKLNVLLNILFCGLVLLQKGPSNLYNGLTAMTSKLIIIFPIIYNCLVSIPGYTVKMHSTNFHFEMLMSKSYAVISFPKQCLLCNGLLCLDRIRMSATWDFLQSKCLFLPFLLIN